MPKNALTMLGTEHFQQKQDQVSKVTNVNNIVRVHLLQDNNIHVYLMLCVFVYICMDVHTYKLINFYYVNLFSKMNGFIIFLGPFLILKHHKYHIYVNLWSLHWKPTVKRKKDLDTMHHGPRLELINWKAYGQEKEKSKELGIC